MYSKIHYSLVGFFVLIFVTGLFGFAFWLAKYGFEKQYDNYYIFFRESVGGLTKNSSVKLNGVNVGKINTIKISKDDPQKIRVSVRLEQDTPIMVDMHAMLKMQGITGLSYLEILGGSKESERLLSKEGETPVIKTKISMMNHITQSADNMMVSLMSTMEKIERLLSNENQKNMALVLKNSAELTKKGVALEDNITKLIGEMSASLKPIKKMASAVKSTSRNIEKLTHEVRRTVKRGDYNLKRMLKPINVDIKEMTHQIRDLSTDIQGVIKNPSRILFDATSQPKGPGE